VVRLQLVIRKQFQLSILYLVETVASEYSGISTVKQETVVILESKKTMGEVNLH